MLQSKYNGMNTARAILATNNVRDQRTRVRLGMRVRRRPTKSPVFQKRKARGMKQAGWRRRGAAEVGRTLVICWVKTGKTIVTAKVRKTALEM